MDIKRQLNAIFYQYTENIQLGYGVKLSRFDLVEEEIHNLFKNELRECYKDAKQMAGEYSEKEFEAWFNYKYKTNLK